MDYRVKSNATAKETELFCGAAEANITPIKGTQLGGDVGRRRPARIMIEPIFARVVILQTCEKKICIISMEQDALSRTLSDKLRNKISEKYDIQFGAIMVHALQIHATPVFGHFDVYDGTRYITEDLEWLRGSDINYHEFCINRIMEAVGKAINSLRPVDLGYSRWIDGSLANVRRYVMRDGKTRMLPGMNNSDILRVESVADSEVGVICLNDDKLENIAFLLNFTSHPVHGYPKDYVIGGWPGAWAKNIKTLFGNQCVPAVLNGCCGNVYHANHLVADYAYEREDGYIAMGIELANDTVKAMKRMKWSDDKTIAFKTKMVKIPFRNFPQQKIEEAKKLLEKNPKPIWTSVEEQNVSWDWMFAVATMQTVEASTKNEFYNYEVQAFRVGDTAFIGLDGEPFVEAQFKIKEASIAKETFVVHLCNGYVGYLPTQEAFNRGGFETEVLTAARLIPEALEMVTEAAIELLTELFV